MGKVILIFTLLVACKSEPSAKSTSTQQSSSGANESVASSAASSTASTSAPTPEQLKEIRGRLSTIETQLAKARGLAFKQSVPADYQTPDEFEAYVRKQMDAEYPKEIREPESKAMFVMGFVKDKVDLGQALLDVAVSQAAAHYDPNKKAFYFLLGANSIDLLETFAAHELVHALQDQHFDLKTYGESAKPKGFLDDRQVARMFVWEGEATLLMMQHEISKRTKQDLLDPQTKSMAIRQLSLMANLDVNAQLSTMRAQGQTLKNAGIDVSSAIAKLDSLPPLLTVPMMDAYMKGQLAIFHRYNAGGWAAVDDLYKNPPQSSEQMLHAESKFDATLDLPQTITFSAPPKGYKTLLTNNIGELSWRVYFDLWQSKNTKQAAAGWDGSQYAFYENDKGEPIAVIATVWDSEKDATEFREAYEKSIATRFPNAMTKPFAGGFDATLATGQLVALRQTGKRVDVVHGSALGSMPAWLAHVKAAKVAIAPADKKH